MDLNFSLEDIEIEINVDPENTEGASVSQAEVAEDNRVDEEVEEQVEEVENILAFGNQVSETIDNLFMIHNHVARFGFNKPMLDLLNADNKIGNLIGRTLPTFESDELPEEVEIPEDVDIEMSLESIMDRIKGAGRAIAEFFKKLYNKMVDFFTKHFGQAQRLEKKFKKLKDYLNSSFTMDEGKARERKIKIYKAADLNKAIETVEGELNRYKGLTEAGGSIESIKAETLKKSLDNAFPETLKLMGVEFKATLDEQTKASSTDDDKKSVKKLKVSFKKLNTPGLKKEEGNLISLGYSKATFTGSAESKVGTAIEILKKKRETISSFKAAAAKVEAQLSGDAKPDDIANARLIQAYAGANTQMFVKASNFCGSLIATWLGLGFSLPKKKD